MIEHDYYELFQDDSIDKQLIIETDGGFTIGNEDIFSESMEITESLCSETQLTFGCCEASSFKIKIANIMSPLIGQWLTVSMQLDHRDEKFQIGKYKVYSDTPTADRKWREIVAYDVMYVIINSEVSDWYNELLPEADSTVTLKQFRDSFFEYFGIEQEEIELVNDSMIVEQTISPSELSGKDVITAICEINGCFGHITRDGKFRYIYLTQDIEGLYPREDLYPADNVYPKDPRTTPITKGIYISATYEDYKCSSITKLQIRKEENDVGSIVGVGGNTYIIQDNFLVYGKGAEELEDIANNILSKILKCIYRPFTAEIKGNFCFEVGEAIRLSTKYEIVESYVLQCTHKGIQALRSTFTATGEEEYNETVNGLNKSIVELKGKTNVLTRNVEETNSRLTDTENKLESEITQLAGQIILKVDADGNIVEVKLEANAETGSVFEVKAKNINMTAEETIALMSNGDINLTGKNITITSNNFKVDAQGNVQCNNMTAISLSGGAISQINKIITDSNVMQTAQQAIQTAQSAAETAQQAAETANGAAGTAQQTANTANQAAADAKSAADKAQQAIDSAQTSIEFSYNSVVTHNNWFNQVSAQLQALGQPGISGT